MSVAPTDIVVNRNGGSEPVEINTAGEWTVQCDAAWIHLSRTEGRGFGTVILRIDENTGADERSSVVKIFGGGASEQVKVTQTATEEAMSLSAYSKNVRPDGEEFVVEVSNGGADWVCEIPGEAQRWISVSEKTPVSLVLSVRLNNNKVKREAVLAFKSQNNGERTLTVAQDAFTQTVKGKWLNIALSQPDAWYSTNEACEVAENVLLYQRDNGGWPKNTEIHLLLTDAEKEKVASEKGEEGCFDNDATTTEMRFLAKMYRHVPDRRYAEAFSRGVDCLTDAQYANGGWPQFATPKGGYHDHITFNDNLTVNILELLDDIRQEKGDFAFIVEDEITGKAGDAYSKGVDCILKCQIRDDEGNLTFWAAQYDENTLEPAEGRPHELPSYSGGEGSDILEFLMRIEDPSEEVKNAVRAAAEWIEKVKIPDKKVVDDPVEGRKIVDAPGKAIWGRFIQLEGKLAERVYRSLFDQLKNSHRAMVKDGVSFDFNYGENAKASYNPDMALKPVFGIYDAGRPYYLYRFLYSYEDEEPSEFWEKDGVRIGIPTSLDAENRRNYQYMGDWPQTALDYYYDTWSGKY